MWFCLGVCSWRPVRDLLLLEDGLEAAALGYVGDVTQLSEAELCCLPDLMPWRRQMETLLSWWWTKCSSWSELALGSHLLCTEF
jgi:hypothetical protein